MKWIGLIIIALPMIIQIHLIIKTLKERELLPRERFFMELIKRCLR
jgi:hypothetical protein